MAEAKYDDDGQFTNEYKLKIAIHPVIQGLFSIVLHSKKEWADLSPRQRYENFFEGIELASQPADLWILIPCLWCPNIL